MNIYLPLVSFRCGESFFRFIIFGSILYSLSPVLVCHISFDFKDIACTVEMTDTDEPVEVAVVDEFQMLGDPGI